VTTRLKLSSESWRNSRPWAAAALAAAAARAGDVGRYRLSKAAVDEKS
jgi:hypothetical protein